MSKNKLCRRSYPETAIYGSFFSFHVAYTSYSMSCSSHVRYLERLPRPSTYTASLCTCSYTGGLSTLTWHDGLTQERLHGTYHKGTIVCVWDIHAICENLASQQIYAIFYLCDVALLEQNERWFLRTDHLCSLPWTSSLQLFGSVLSNGTFQWFRLHLA